MKTQETHLYRLNSCSTVLTLNRTAKLSRKKYFLIFQKYLSDQFFTIAIYVTKYIAIT